MAPIPLDSNQRNWAALQEAETKDYLFDDPWLLEKVYGDGFQKPTQMNWKGVEEGVVKDIPDEVMKRYHLKFNQATGRFYLETPLRSAACNNSNLGEDEDERTCDCGFCKYKLSIHQGTLSSLRNVHWGDEIGVPKPEAPKTTEAPAQGSSKTSASTLSQKSPY
jgi:hypothetical protein